MELWQSKTEMRTDRIKILQKSLQQPLLIKKPENLLYLTGQSFMHGHLLVAKNEVVFFGDGLEKVEGMKKVDYLGTIPTYLKKHKELLIEDQFTFAEFDYIKRKIKKAGLRVAISHARSPVDYQRQIKDKNELQLVRKSMQIVEQVFSQVLARLHSAGPRPAIMEGELAEFIKREGFKLGAENVSFPPIVASGANAAVPHHVPSSKILKRGEPIILDFGFKYKNYCSDFTRTIFLGSAPKKLSDAYNQTERAYWESINLGSKNAEDVYQRSVDVLAEKKLDKYFIHSLGHGTGLEIHELPNLSPLSKDGLKDGMVFSIEPGVYFPRVGGIRIEDLVYMEKGKIKKFINVSTKLEDNIINI